MRSKFWIFPFALLLSLTLSSCGSQGAGPRTWIDWPLEENNPVEVEPILVMAHSSDADGVGSMVFSVDGSEITESSLGGGRLESASFEWMPPGPGKYILSVFGTDGSGARGAAASVEVSVGSDEILFALEPTATVERTVESVTPTRKPTKMGTPTLTAPPPPEEREEPSGTLTKNANCRRGASTAFDIVAILLQGQTVPIVGKSPDQYYLVVIEPTYDRQCWLATNLVDVTGNLAQVSVIQPPPLPITVTVTSSPTTPAPPPDTNPPVITSITLSPSTITVSGGGCAGEPRTSTSTLSIYEPGGISSVSASWTLGSLSGTVPYFTSDGTTYVGSFGPVDNHGTMEIYGSVVDKAGNWTPFVQSLTVQPCID
ncbi:MAG: hypothetical protein PVI81_05785 [Anaerolineales bacterium]